MAGVVVLGGGKMGEALVAGLVDAGHEPSAIEVVEVVATRRAELATALPGVRVVGEPGELTAEPSVLVVAVKPGDVGSALRAVVTALAPDTLVVSIAAGVPTDVLEASLAGQPVVRAMPNTPALVRCGATAIAPGRGAGAEHLDRAAALLSAVGVVVRVPEHLLDAVTGLSGSGPAYVFLVAEALVEAGVLVGLPRDVAATLVHQTLLGSATLLASSADGPEALRAAVTSPGGTTAAGLRALEARATRAALADAVVAATERSRELGREASSHVAH
jgi:pyrroline-5-carboxylate reductase